MQIYLARNNQQAGPYTLEQVNQMLADQQILLTDLAWHQGMTEWKALGELTQGKLVYEPVGYTAPISLNKTEPFSNTSTPTQSSKTQQNVELAPLHSRFFAKIIDLLLWLPTSIILGLFLNTTEIQKLTSLQDQMLSKAQSNDVNQVLEIQSQMLALFPGQAWIAMFGYIFIMLAVQAYFLSKSGQSIGKKALKIKIVDEESNEKVSFLRVFVLRSILFIVIYRFLGLFAIVDLLFAFSKKRQTLHDKLVKTKVIKQ
ncbi:RDD family protein [Acinetobacter piscicola]|uniref:RDD family protein n=1 Tax=Acinetobacter piscicola TaxID=2006115 RepID=UPI0010222503|nr:RDD family protein [Acinetobacter piscicola]RYL27645.1 RDD family protein [Acinetobacter piscicola]